MSELFIATLFILCVFVIIPFIAYCIMVFVESFEDIHYMRDYIYCLNNHELKWVFMTPVVGFFASVYIIFFFTIAFILNSIKFVWNLIPKSSMVENKCICTWNKFSDWFMNIKIRD